MKKIVVKSSTTKKPLKKTGTATSEKDQKILWSRAAGLCSICRKKLTMDTTVGAATLGEMCHIVGEKNSTTNARGISSMLLGDRNKYSNLILLCAHHHKKIDRDEKKYTIEYLHSIKDEHELWVEETLSAQVLKADELVYSTLIDHLTINLQLESWNWFIGNASRQLVHREFVDAYDSIQERQMAAIFPGTEKKLEAAIKNLMAAYVEYMKQFLRGAKHELNDDYFRPDLSYKSVSRNPDYSYYSDLHSLWARKNFHLLCQYVVRLNEFADAVRKYSNPLYFVVRGKFLVLDEMGTHSGGSTTIYLPESKLVSQHIEVLDKEFQEFEITYKKTIARLSP